MSFPFAATEGRRLRMRRGTVRSNAARSPWKRQPSLPPLSIRQRLLRPRPLFAIATTASLAGFRPNNSANQRANRSLELPCATEPRDDRRRSEPSALGMPEINRYGVKSCRRRPFAAILIYPPMQRQNLFAQTRDHMQRDRYQAGAACIARQPTHTLITLCAYWNRVAPPLSEARAVPSVGGPGAAFRRQGLSRCVIPYSCCSFLLSPDRLQQVQPVQTQDLFDPCLGPAGIGHGIRDIRKIPNLAEAAGLMISPKLVRRRPNPLSCVIQSKNGRS